MTTEHHHEHWQIREIRGQGGELEDHYCAACGDRVAWTRANGGRWVTITKPEMVSIPMTMLETLTDAAENSESYEYARNGVPEAVGVARALLEPQEATSPLSGASTQCTQHHPRHVARCERPEGHEGMHAYADPTGHTLWGPGDVPSTQRLEAEGVRYVPECEAKDPIPDPPKEKCSVRSPHSGRECTKPLGHEGDHRHNIGGTWSKEAAPASTAQQDVEDRTSATSEEIDRWLGTRTPAGMEPEDTNYREIRFNGYAREGVAEIKATMCIDCGGLIASSTLHDQFCPARPQVGRTCNVIEPGREDHPCVKPIGHFRSRTEGGFETVHKDRTGHEWSTEA